jgi:hypothetical protein
MPQPAALIAEFDTADALLAGVRGARREGYARLEAYSPFSLEGLTEVLNLPPSRVRWVMLAGGVLGAAGGLGLQYWSAVVAYPINSGGRPLASYAAFIPVTFELMVLFAALCGFVAFLLSAGLPRPHHPVFAVEGFERASSDGFFLEIMADDPRFETAATRRFLESLGARRVGEVLR